MNETELEFWKQLTPQEKLWIEKDGGQKEPYLPESYNRCFKEWLKKDVK